MLKAHLLPAFLLASALALAACAAPGQPAASSPEPSPAQTEENPMIAEICAKPERYVGSVVTLQGLFQGWQTTGCRFPEGAANKPITRSDWLLRSGEDCVYVTGGMPKDLDPLKPENLGRRLELEAQVMRDTGGRIYLAYRSSRSL